MMVTCHVSPFAGIKVKPQPSTILSPNFGGQMSLKMYMKASMGAHIAGWVIRPPTKHKCHCICWHATNLSTWNTWMFVPLGKSLENRVIPKVLTWLNCMPSFAAIVFLSGKVIDAEAVEMAAFGTIFIPRGLPRTIIIDADGLFAGVFKGSYYESCYGGLCNRRTPPPFRMSASAEVAEQGGTYHDGRHYIHIPMETGNLI
jgi:hypothetical protein